MASYSRADDRNCSWHPGPVFCESPEICDGFHGTSFASVPCMAGVKRFVYVLKSQSSPARYYTGLTSNVAARLAAHHAGHCPHTAQRGPWNIDVVVEFADEKRAVGFERYLKSGSGVAFAKRHMR